MRALELLTSKLAGQILSQFSVGETWELYFGGYWLIAQNIISEDEGLLNQWLFKEYTPAQNAIDKEYMSKCAILASHLQKEVTGLKLDESYTLTIEFEKDRKLLIPTNATIVDWQWCLNLSGSNPYYDYLVACFQEGEIQIKDE